MNKNRFFLKFCLFLLFLALIIFIVICRTFFWLDDEVIYEKIDHVSQNTLNWANKSTFTIDHNLQQKLVKNYLNQYFSSWDRDNIKKSLQKVRDLELSVIQQYVKNPGWDVNRNKHTKRWIYKIINNMNLNSFPNLNMKGIMIVNTDVRIIPTISPSFNDVKKPGEGYPFDKIQVSHIYANTPIAILHISKDGAWHLIKTSGYIGWVKNDATAFVNSKFIQNWKKKSYIAATKNNVSMFNNEFNYRAKTHLGILYPLVRVTRSYYKVLIAVSSPCKYAQFETVSLSKNGSTIFPILINPYNIAKIANTMIGQTYGWGGLYEYNDCSALMMYLFANLGIWLPRNSMDQITIGNQISLKGLSDAQKEALIIKKGIPFLTLIHKPGHIMLYIGHIGKDVYILHAFWGIKTKNLLLQEKRAILGKTAITPLHFAHHFLNVPNNFIHSIDKMSLLYN